MVKPQAPWISLYTGVTGIKSKDQSNRPTEISGPLDLSHHFSVTAKRRLASDVKKFYKFFAIPGIHNMAGGMPNASYFPFDTLEAQIAQPERFNASVAASKGHKEHSQPSRLFVPKDSDFVQPQDKIDVSTALQYGTAEGFPPLLSFVREFVREHLHPNVPYTGGPEVILTCGSTDGFSKSIELLTNVWNDERGDKIEDREAVLCEEYTYTNAIQAVSPHGVNIVPVSMDENGMKAHGKGGLADILKNWDITKGKRPHVMYTITIGQNPTGCVMPIERKKEIYALCQRYDIVICEDEPYWHLQYPSALKNHQGLSDDCADKSDAGKSTKRGRSSGYSFLDSLVPSYLSIDTDGRVIRIDTFSKTVAPGCRLGWITAQPQIIERLTRIAETSTQQPSGFVQAMVAKMIIKQKQSNGLYSMLSGKTVSGWDMSGWVRWLEGLRASYERRMQTMCQILEAGQTIVGDHDEDTDEADEWSMLSQTKIYEFNYPGGGMFVWLRILIETHPLYQSVELPNLLKALFAFLTREPYRALGAPGSIFDPLGHSDPWQYPPVSANQAFRYVRLCFVAMQDDDVAVSSHGFVNGIQAFWAIKDKKKIDDILKDADAFAALDNHLVTMFC